MSDKEREPPRKKAKLSKASIALIERKRQNAILLRESRLKLSITRPPTNAWLQCDTKSGFFSAKNDTLKSVFNEDADLLNANIKCRECTLDCNASYLYTKFRELICDECRDKDKNQYNLISKTDSKNQYVLKDCDLDFREPPLRYISAPNPHSSKGTMKLYLEGQIFARACEVHGGEEGIEIAIQKRQDNREVAAQRKLEKKLIQLRQFSKERKPKQVHVHEFSEEIYKEEDDCYEHACKLCGYVESYEKL